MERTVQFPNKEEPKSLGKINNILKTLELNFDLSEEMAKRLYELETPKVIVGMPFWFGHVHPYRTALSLGTVYLTAILNKNYSAMQERDFYLVVDEGKVFYYDKRLETFGRLMNINNQIVSKAMIILNLCSLNNKFNDLEKDKDNQVYNPFNDELITKPKLDIFIGKEKSKYYQMKHPEMESVIDFEKAIRGLWS